MKSRGARQFTPSLTAGLVAGVITALLCAVLQAAGVQLDVDLATIISDLFGGDETVDPLNISVRQIIVLGSTALVGWFWPEASAREMLAEGPADLDDSGERDAAR